MSQLSSQSFKEDVLKSSQNSFWTTYLKQKFETGKFSLFAFLMRPRWYYDMIWYDMIYDIIYDMISYDIVWYMIWYDMIWYYSLGYHGYLN